MPLSLLPVHIPCPRGHAAGSLWTILSGVCSNECLALRQLQPALLSSFLSTREARGLPLIPNHGLGVQACACAYFLCAYVCMCVPNGGGGCENRREM